MQIICDHCHRPISGSVEKRLESLNFHPQCLTELVETSFRFGDQHSTCTICGKLVVASPWRLSFTSHTIGWTSTIGDKHQALALHEECYPKGRAKLLSVLRNYKFNAQASGLGSGNAWVELDPRDAESDKWPDGKISSDAVSYTGLEDLAESGRDLWQTVADGWRSLPRLVRFLIKLVALVLAYVVLPWMWHAWW